MSATIGSLTKGNSVLLYLLRFPTRVGERAFPVEVTQAVISRALGIKKGYVSVILRRLVEQEYVVYKSEYVIGKRRKMKVARLTQAGRELAVRLKAVMREELKLQSEGNGGEESEGQEEPQKVTSQQTDGGSVPMSPSTFTVTFIIDVDGSAVFLDE